MVSSSSDLSIESLLKNLRPTSNTGSLPSTSSSMYAGRHKEDDHEQFVQAVQAIVTSDESQFQSPSPSSSAIVIEDDERSHGTMSDDTNRGRGLFDKYESHSSEDRDHSLEDLISRLVAAQQQSKHRQYQSKYFLEMRRVISLTKKKTDLSILVVDSLFDINISRINSEK